MSFDESPGPHAVSISDIIELELRDVSCACEGQEAVRNASARFARGRFHVLRGAAEEGCGTLLRLLGLLRVPDAGEVFVRGSATRALSEAARAALRTQRFGFVFAAPFLLSSFTVIENVAMPLFKISQVGPDEARRRTEAVLEFTELAGAAEMAVDELSPPAQFRTALARGLINEPSVLIVENLDGMLTGRDLQSFLAMLHRAGEIYGTTILASASPGLMLTGRERVLDIAGGRIVADTDPGDTP